MLIYLTCLDRQSTYICLISTLRPRYIPSTVMAKIMSHTLHVIKLFSVIGFVYIAKAICCIN